MKKRKTAKPYEFFDEIFRFQWLLIIGGTQKEGIEYFAKRIGVDAWECSGMADGHFAAHRPLKCGLLWFKDMHMLKIQGAHECFHGTMYLFETLGMEGPVEKTEEVFAYYMQWLLNMTEKLAK